MHTQSSIWMLSKFVQPLWIFDAFCSKIIIFTERTCSVWSLWIERLNSISHFWLLPFTWPILDVQIVHCSFAFGKEDLLSSLTFDPLLSNYQSKASYQMYPLHEDSLLTFTEPLLQIMTNSNDVRQCTFFVIRTVRENEAFKRARGWFFRPRMPSKT